MPAGVVVGMDAVGRDFVGAVEILSVNEMEVLVFGHAFRAEVMEQPLHFTLSGFQFGPQPALDMARGGDEDDLRVGHFRADTIQEGGHVLADDVRPHVVHGIDDEHFHALQFDEQFGDFHVEAAAAGEAEIHERHIQVARKDLRDADTERAILMAQDEAEPLTAAMVDLLSQLSEKERTGILNTIRTDAWFNSPLAPALEAAVEALTEPEEEPEEEPWDDDSGYDEADG